MRTITILALAGAVLGFPPSQHMLDSLISRKQGVVSSGAASSTLESGFLGQAIEAVIAQYPATKPQYSSYLTTVLDLASVGFDNATYGATRPLDRFSLATAIHTATRRCLPVTEATKKAYQGISASLALQKRNPDNGLWYYVYPEWSYLDGMYSLLPFMAEYGRNESDMKLQIDLLHDHCGQASPPLLVHGYDWSKTAVWANKETGASPYVWGRSLGWFLSGLVQTWDALHCHKHDSRLCSDLKNLTTSISAGLVDAADEETGAWWQIVTLPGNQGNYLESSATALFTFSMLKAVRIGLLYGKEPNYKGAAEKAYAYMGKAFVTDTGNGTVGFDKTVSVCSLNSTATYDYYVTRPFVPNSLLGEAAYILASLEMERH